MIYGHSLTDSLTAHRRAGVSFHCNRYKMS